MKKTIDVREKQEINLVDFRFDELMSDPIAILKRCYQVLQINWSDNLETVFKNEV
jgi:uncharacterized Ntn-hydrolase superfamily protein